MEINGNLKLDDLPANIRARFEEAIELAEENGDEIAFIDGMEGAIVGTMIDDSGAVVAVYERELCIKYLASTYTDKDIHEIYPEIDMQDRDKVEQEKYTMALEWFEYNTLRALPYMSHPPVIISGFRNDDGMWIKFIEGEP